jgi:hypothetical protein
MKERVLYEVDPHNRLVIKKSGRASNLKRFRKVVEGRFKTDTENKLYYEVSKPSQSDVPQKIKFSGEYSLDKSHNLIYRLDKWGDQYAGNRLRLKGGIIDAKSNEIVFLISSKEASYTMSLRGAWHADKNNRLSFGVEKEGDKPDELAFFNAWKIGRNNEIIYRYGRDSSIALNGTWDIKDKATLSYVLDKDMRSGFDFRVSAGQMVPRKEKSYLKFDVSIDISKRKRINRKIIFCGTCRLSEDKEILLEYSPDKEKELSLKLTKDIFDKRGIAYIESFIGEKERYLGGGIAFRW